MKALSSIKTEKLLEELGKRLGKDDGQCPDEDAAKDFESLSKPVRDFFTAAGLALLFKKLGPGGAEAEEDEKKDSTIRPAPQGAANEAVGYEPVKAGGYSHVLGLVPAQSLGLSGDAGHLYECSQVGTGEMIVTILCHVRESEATRARMARMKGGAELA